MLDGRLILGGHPDGVRGLDLRQLCNLIYAHRTEWMEPKEHEKFDRQLEAQDPRTVSVGTADLMRLMGVPTQPVRRDG